VVVVFGRRVNGASAELSGAIRTAVEAVRSRVTATPEYAIILGTGLGRLAEEIDSDATIPYAEIPGFPLSTVETHTGRLIVGRLEGRPVAAMQGRFHRYEGYSLPEVTFPVRVLGQLGARTLIVSNVSGGMNPLWQAGDLVLLDDHINLLGDSPLIGPNLDELGPRFPDMSEPYDRGLQARAEDAALELGFPLRRGVYVAVSGPNLETRAEYRMLRSIGADVVGMSTVPEVIVARHMGMRVLGLSIITDECFPDALMPADIDAIIRTAMEAEPRLTALIRRVIELDGGATKGMS
jgi:purine-nucleoside phosphorylase